MATKKKKDGRSGPRSPAQKAATKRMLSANDESREKAEKARRYNRGKRTATRIKKERDKRGW